MEVGREECIIDDDDRFGIFVDKIGYVLNVDDLKMENDVEDYKKFLEFFYCACVTSFSLTLNNRKFTKVFFGIWCVERRGGR